MATWHTTVTARAAWPGTAPNDDTLTGLLAAAKDQCIAFGGVLPNPDDIPEGWRIAHLAQARALWKAQYAAPNDGLDSDGQTVTIYPMDWQVKSLLRPTRGVPGIA